MIPWIVRHRWASHALSAFLVVMASNAPAMAQNATPLAFSEIPGWADDDHQAALSVFKRSCNRIRSTSLIPASDWAGLCARANASGGSARAFFEQYFQPVTFDDGTKPLLTAYYEPEVSGSLTPDATYRYPLFRPPPGLPKGQPWKTRAEIEAGALDGRGLELVWLKDPVEAFFLHVQGSGRIHLRDGSTLRVGFAGRNGQPYRSVGKEMVRRGLLAPTRVSAERIGAFVRQNPELGRDLLNHNPSYIFFREVEAGQPGDGPIGALGVPVTQLRSLAVDANVIPLGAPVWVAMKGKNPLARLMVAQDVGSAIHGAQRGDIFFGSGPEAGNKAGRIRAPGHLIVLLPKKSARRLFATE